MERSHMEEFAQRGWSQSKRLEQQLCVGSCSLHLRFLIFRMEKTWSLNALLRTSFCFQLKWCIYFMLGILKLLCTLTSFISASSLMHFTHSKIIRDIYEVNTMHNRLSYLVIFLFLVPFIHLRMWSLEMGRLPGQGRPGNTPSSNGTRYYLIWFLMWFVMQHGQELIFLVDRNSHSFTPVTILSKFI